MNDESDIRAILQVMQMLMMSGIGYRETLRETISSRALFAHRVLPYTALKRAGGSPPRRGERSAMKAVTVALSIFVWAGLGLSFQKKVEIPTKPTQEYQGIMRSNAALVDL